MIRVDKYLAQQGLASRREVKVLVERKMVKINGKVAKEPGDKFDPGKDVVEITGKGKAMQQSRETVLIYKPRGVVSAKDEGSGKNLFSVFPQYKHLNCVGRLDKESQGLILLSNDGLITKAITGKDHLLEKEYEVTVRENILPFMMEKMTEGIKLEDGWTRPAKATKVSKHVFRIVLREGKKHQIRRMANAMRLTITKLERVRVAHLGKKYLRGKKSRQLEPKDIEAIKLSGLPKKD